LRFIGEASVATPWAATCCQQVPSSEQSQPLIGNQKSPRWERQGRVIFAFKANIFIFNMLLLQYFIFNMLYF